MPLKVQKQNRESTQGLIRRFSQKMRKSGILLEARKKQFRRREKSSQLKKRAALRREELRKRYEKLKKLGRI
jgi:ribosomal protein S21